MAHHLLMIAFASKVESSSGGITTQSFEPPDDSGHERPICEASVCRFAIAQRWLAAGVGSRFRARLTTARKGTRLPPPCLT